MKDYSNCVILQRDLIKIGLYHGFMPVAIEGVEAENFLVWLDQV